MKLICIKHWVSFVLDGRVLELKKQLWWGDNVFMGSWRRKWSGFFQQWFSKPSSLSRLQSVPLYLMLRRTVGHIPSLCIAKELVRKSRCGSNRLTIPVSAVLCWGNLANCHSHRFKSVLFGFFVVCFYCSWRKFPDENSSKFYVGSEYKNVFFLCLEMFLPFTAALCGCCLSHRVVM